MAAMHFINPVICVCLYPVRQHVTHMRYGHCMDVQHTWTDSVIQPPTQQITTYIRHQRMNSITHCSPEHGIPSANLQALALYNCAIYVGRALSFGAVLLARHLHDAPVRLADQVRARCMQVVNV